MSKPWAVHLTWTLVPRHGSWIDWEHCRPQVQPVGHRLWVKSRGQHVSHGTWSTCLKRVDDLSSLAALRIIPSSGRTSSRSSSNLLLKSMHSRRSWSRGIFISYRSKQSFSWVRMVYGRRTSAKYWSALASLLTSWKSLMRRIYHKILVGFPSVRIKFTCLLCSRELTGDSLQIIQ
jgi:hypothetical protein